MNDDLKKKILDEMKQLRTESAEDAAAQLQQWSSVVGQIETILDWFQKAKICIEAADAMRGELHGNQMAPDIGGNMFQAARAFDSARTTFEVAVLSDEKS